MGSISGIILAAGESTRMGSLKALLPWHGLTLIEYQVESLKSAGVSDVVVVVGHRADEVGTPIRFKRGVKVVLNPDYKQGKVTSVKAGLRNLSNDCDVIVVLAVDQPRPAKLLASLIEAHVGNNLLVTYPVYQGSTGHPLIFDCSLLPELLAITEEEQGLRAITRRYVEYTYQMDVDNPIVLADVNSPGDLSKARGLFLAEGEFLEHKT